MAMTQTALPASDVSTGSWTPTPVWPKIKVPSPPDLQYVTSSANPAGDAFVVNLKPLAWPDSGPQTVMVRLKATASNGPNVSVVLLQSGTPIAGWNISAPSTSFPDYPFELTAAQVALITDYTQLQLQVIAGGVTTTCCPSYQVPNFLNVTVTNGNLCNGTYPILCTSSGLTASWTAPAKLGSCSNGGFTLSCPPGGWIMLVNPIAGPYGASTQKCDPLLIVFTGVDLSRCGGTTNTTLTVTT